MLIKYVCNGSPERIPAIGAVLDLPAGSIHPDFPMKFKVTGYGESAESQLPITYDGGLAPYEIELEGNVIIPSGTPISVFEQMLGGLDKES